MTFHDAEFVGRYFNIEFVPRYFDDGTLSPVQRWVTGDLISLDMLAAITKISISTFNNIPSYREHGQLYLTFSFVFTPVEVPFQGLSEKCSLNYCFKLDEHIVLPNQMAPSGAHVVNESAFGKTYHTSDPDGNFTYVNKVQKRIDELVSYWEQYKIQRKVFRDVGAV
jgi:hypothetical protein